MFTPNIPLLRKAVEWTEAQDQLPRDEREWDQASWINKTDCGTTYCVAGYLALNSDQFAGMYYNPVVDETASSLVRLKNGEMEVISDLAADELGIDPEEAIEDDGLFEATNTVADIRRIAERLAGERL